MIRCPYCKSTAQVKMNGTAVLSRNKQYLELSCECGCGCQFMVDYNIADYEEATILTIDDKKSKE